ncbi:Coronin-like protein crn1 [Yarrowia sp. C11]|nr:Coronin-like protein crn1 [Yarrowia sp. E02]KAG5369874.1 Coronin-like protein crn1 [Yarrowia sp. C11]
MSGRFVRSSKYRHVYGQSTKKELCYDNVRVSNNAWDSNLLKVNPEYISLNWEASGGGAFAVIPLSHKGKLPDQIPLFRGHTSAVLDTDFNPFNDQVIASASDDGKIGIWKVPDDYRIVYEPEEEIEDVAPVAKLSGHQRKVGHVKFHPTANNVLASSSADYTVKLWDVEAQKAHQSLAHKDIITSFDYNQDGTLMVTTSRDKQIRVWDLRTGEIVSSGAGHTGAKNSRVVWLDSERIATTGFSKLSDRQLALWNATDIGAGPIGGFRYLDSSSGICMPFYDHDTKTLFLAGKGDGNIRYYEYGNDDFFELSEYQSTDPQRGIAFMPKRALNIKGNEIVRAYKTVKDSYVEPVGFYVPRRAETFQSDIYPDCYAGVPSVSAEEFFEGKSARPNVIEVEILYEDKPITKDNVHEAAEDKTEFKKEPTPAPSSAPASKGSESVSKSAEPKEEKPDLQSKGSFGTSSSAFSGDKVNSMLAKASEEDEPRKKDDENNDEWENSGLLATRNRLAKTGKIEVVHQAASGGKTLTEKEIGAMVKSGKISSSEGAKAVEKVREEEAKEAKEAEEAEEKKPEPVEEKKPEPVVEKKVEPIQKKVGPKVEPKSTENGKDKTEEKEINPLPLLKEESLPQTDSATTAAAGDSDKRISSLEELVHSLVSQVKSQQETIQQLSKKLDACTDCCASDAAPSKNECANRPEGAEQCDNCDC